MNVQMAMILCVGLLVLGGIAITAMLTGEDGVVVAGVMSAVSAVMTGTIGYQVGKHKQKKLHAETTRREIAPDP